MKIKTLGTLAVATLLSVSLNTAQAEKAATDKAPAKKEAGKQSDRRPDRPTRESIIKRFDKDGDGKLSEAERAAARKAFSSRGGRTTDRAPSRISEGLRERYRIASKKIQEDLKAGKITKEQARERQEALRKRLAQSAANRGGDRDSDRSRFSREAMMKQFDKNKDGKLDEAERNALRKAMTERFRNRGGDRRGGERGERSRRGGEAAERGGERRRRGGEGVERRRRGGEGGGEGERRRRGRRGGE